MLASLLFCGCEAGSFYRQAAAGQWEILTHQQSIRQLAADPKTEPRLKTQLEEVLQIRQFAQNELKLPAGNHYLAYADLHRPFVIWNVCAAPELSLEPKTWWYPIVGSASYRGYFREKSARVYAAELEKKGWDVYVGGVQTYSTLGWFHDPVLNTFVYEPQGDLAEIIFHELAHQRLFIADDTDFNEAFATAVAQEGVRRWFNSLHQTNSLDSYHREQEQDRQFTALVLGAIQQLDAVYTNSNLSDETKRQRKAELIEQMCADHKKIKAQWGGASPYDGWFAAPINNAKLSTVATYYELVPTFHAVLAASGNDLERFFKTVENISKLPPEKRILALKQAGAPRKGGSR